MKAKLDRARLPGFLGFKATQTWGILVLSFLSGVDYQDFLVSAQTTLSLEYGILFLLNFCVIVSKPSEAFNPHK